MTKSMIAVILLSLGTAAATALPVAAQTTRPNAAAMAELQRYRQAERLAQERLRTFDHLDFDVFSNQRWDELHETHADNIKVYWPDGHVEVGVATHIESLKKLFVYAPDTRIKQHPAKLAQGGEWVAIYGIMEGTFTQPMTLPDGKVVQPTGMAFKLPMATIGHWANGKMDAEYLFWDNASYYKQLGVKM